MTDWHAACVFDFLFQSMIRWDGMGWDGMDAHCERGTVLCTGNEAPTNDIGVLFSSENAESSYYVILL